MAILIESIGSAKIKLKKNEIENCTNCIHGKKSLLRKRYSCKFVLGLNLEDGKYGRCPNYERSINQ